MHIRTADLSDLPAMEQLYEAARGYMAQEGNATQWGSIYPLREWLEQDIAEGISHVCEQDGTVVGTFLFAMGPDPTYAHIEEGQWPDDRPYGVVHRLTTGGSRRGVGTFCLQWCLRQCERLRIDTHRNNRSMLKLLEKLGFMFCGIIYVEDGTPRLAYQRAGDGPLSGSVGQRAEERGH